MDNDHDKYGPRQWEQTLRQGGKSISEREGLLTTLGGGILLLLGLSRLSLRALLMTIGGGYLLYRGTRGKGLGKAGQALHRVGGNADAVEVEEHL